MAVNKNKFQLIHPFVSGNIYCSNSLKNVSRKCYNEFKQNNNTSNNFVIMNIVTKETYNYQCKQRGGTIKKDIVNRDKSMNRQIPIDNSIKKENLITKIVPTEYSVNKIKKHDDSTHNNISEIKTNDNSLLMRIEQLEKRMDTMENKKIEH